MSWWIAGILALVAVVNIGVVGGFEIVLRWFDPRSGLPPRKRLDNELAIAVVAITFLLFIPSLSHAQTTLPDPLNLPPAKVEGKAETKIGGQNLEPCVAVDIAGHKAGDEDCAAQKLQNAAKQAQDRTKDQPVPNIPTATSPDTQIGLANEAATKQRLGDNFGKSVLPQRPAPPPVAPSPFARQ